MIFFIDKSKTTQLMKLISNNTDENHLTEILLEIDNILSKEEAIEIIKRQITEV